MLVLTRKPEETIRLGEGVEIRVLRISGDRVRIGISAPQDVRILRGELTPRDAQPQRPAA